MYWTVGADGMINADSAAKPSSGFLFELTGQSKMFIKVSPNSTNKANQYIKGEQNGIFNACKDSTAGATPWEY